MAFGATGVFAGVIGVAHVAAVLIALFQMAAHRLRPTVGNGGERSLVAVGHPVAEFLQVFRAMFSDDLRQFNHG